jgi:hypothetical protein
MVVSDDRSVFKFDKETANRLRQTALQLGAQEGKRVTYKDLLGRALDALERELAAGKAPRKRARA